MEPVFMELAQSAAVAACMAIDASQTVQQVDVEKVQRVLKENPLLDGSIPEIVVDNDDSAHLSVTGDWQKVASGGYGPSFLLAGRESGEARIQFKPDLKLPGRYAIYAYIPRVEKSSTTTTFSVYDGKSSKNIIIRNADLNIQGQTSGEWIFLGKFRLPAGLKSYVTISNKNADGLVAADAILFRPEK